PADSVRMVWLCSGGAQYTSCLGRAEVVASTAVYATLSALAERLGDRLVAHGPRWSVAVIGRGARDAAAALALDVALHDQRGCLSPHAVYVAGEARGFAERLAAALEAVAERLPPGTASIEARAQARFLAAQAEWAAGATVLQGAGGTVIHEGEAAFRPTCGLRTVRVHPLADL